VKLIENGGKGKGVRVRAVKVCRRKRGTAPPWQLHVPATLPGRAGCTCKLSKLQLRASHYKGLTKKLNASVNNTK